MQKENEKDNKSSSPTTINNEENDYTNMQLNLQDHINSLENPIFKEKLLKIYCNVSEMTAYSINKLYDAISGENSTNNSNNINNPVCTNNFSTNISNNIINNNNILLNKKSKRKKSKKTTKNNYGLGLLKKYETKDSDLLYAPYIINENNYYTFLYTIEIKDKNGEKLFPHGFLFPINLGNNLPTIKLIDHETHELSYVNIKNYGNISFDENIIGNFLIYHFYACENLLNGKKNIVSAKVVNYLKHDVLPELTSTKNCSLIFKKYFFIPIIKEKNEIKINYDKIENCISFVGGEFHNIKGIEKCIKGNEKEFVKNFKQKYQNSILVTDYTHNVNYFNLYFFKDIMLKSDDVETFIQKYTFYNKKLYNNIQKQIENLTENKVNPNTKYIMEEMPIPNIEEKKNQNDELTSIIGYRELEKKYGIEISKNNSFYITCEFCSLMSEKKNYIYTRNTESETLSKEVIQKQNNDINMKNTTDKNYAKILPPDKIFNYFLDRNDIKSFELIPSIFTIFEGLLKIPQFISDFSLFQNNKNINYNYLLTALTTIEFLQDFNYEALESLGDSILKMLTTILIYHFHEIRDIETNVIELVVNRISIISNNNLFIIGEKNQIYKYVINYEKTIKDYDFPLKNGATKMNIINLSQKKIADIMESVIGGIFLTCLSTCDCLNFIQFSKIPSFKDYNIKNANLHYINLEKKSYEIMYKKIKTVENFFDIEKINYILKDNYEWINFVLEETDGILCLKKLMKKYYDQCLTAKRNYNITDTKTLEYLEKCKIFYEFKNFHLLKQAMTHISLKNSFSENYERLEFLGDAIVESFISQFVFSVFRDFLTSSNDKNNDKNDNYNILSDYQKIIKEKAKIFSNKYMCHIKSYLCSNFFMCKLCALISLPNFIQINDNSKNLQEQKKNFLHIDNIQKLLNSDMKKYTPSEIYHPKFMADIFESLIGAIYMDSDLKSAFEFLEIIYGPSICYCCFFLDELNFSIVKDFTESCEKEFKIIPKFSKIFGKEVINEKIDYDEKKVYIKLDMGKLGNIIGIGDNEEQAKEYAAVKGIQCLKNQKYGDGFKNEKWKY